MYRLMQPSDWAEVLALWQAQRGDTEEFVRGAVERFAGVQNVYVAEENDHIGGYPVCPAEPAGRRLCGGSARQPGTINAAAG